MRFCLFVLFSIITLPLLAQNTIPPPVKVYALRADAGNVVIHTTAVKNITGAQPYGFSFELSRQQTSQQAFNKSSAYSRYGWQLSHYNFGSSILGSGTIVNYFLQPVYRISNRFQLHMRGSIGMAYLSKPYHAVTHATNQNYSRHFTPYMHVGAGLGYRINEHFGVEISTNFHHTSNGNIKQPNKGLNYTTTGLSVIYSPAGNELPLYKATRNPYWKHQKPWLDVGIIYVPQQDYYSKWQFKRNYVLGLMAQLSKQVGRTNALSFGAEAYYNSITADANSRFTNNKSSVLAGVLGGHEFLFGKITFSQQLGYYLTPHPSYYSNMYFRLGLRYKLTNHWQVGANLKAHADEADFFDFRVLYRW